MASTMKAVQIHRYKEPADFHPRDLPMPRPEGGEVLVQIAYAGVNPSDLGNTQGYFADQTVLPRIIGRDFVGKVVEGPPQLLGAVVMGSGGDIGFSRDGSFSEYIAIPADGAVEVPPGLECSQAATIGVPFLAALACLDCFPKDMRGRNVLLIGGGGAVGSAATIIARKRGAFVVRTILRPAEVAALSEQLQDGVFIDLSKNSDLVAQTSNITDGKGCDFIVNMVGGATFEPSLQCLANYGRMACIATPGQPRVEFNLLEFYRRNLSLYGLNTILDGVVASASKLRGLLKEFDGDVGALASLGETQVMPFSDAKRVLERALAKDLRKPVLKMRE